MVALDLVVFLSVLAKGFYLPLSEQYFYHVYGANVLRDTPFIIPQGPFCITSELIDHYTGSNNSYKQVESSSNHLLVYCQVAYAIPSIALTIVVGPLMDRFGRKIGMIVPILGTTIQGIMSIFIVTFDLNPYYFILANFVGGSFGGLTSILAASFSYVADITSLRWRSLRIGIVEAAIGFGVGVGEFLSGYWLHRINCGFMPPLYFFTASSLFLLAYTALFLPESLTRSERKNLKGKSPRGVRAYIEGFGLFCGRLPPVSTWKIYVATITICVVGLNLFGAMLIDVYFLKALPFDFNSLQIGTFESVRSVSQGLSNVLFMGVFVSLKVGDVWIMLAGVLCHATCCMLLGFSTKAWQIYAVAPVKGIEGLVWSAGRGLLSKQVKPEQQGAIFSIIASLESVVTLLAGVIWPLIFPFTLQHGMRTGMTYIFMAALGFSPVPLLISLLFLRKKVVKDEVVTNRLAGEASSDSSEEEYQPLISNSWNSETPHYKTVNT